MIKLDARLDMNLETFFRWWLGELSFLVPAKLLKLMGKGRDRLVIYQKDGLLSLVHVGAQGAEPLGQWPLEEGGQRGQLFAQHPELEEAELRLSLAPGQFLLKEFKLPAVAEENLRQVAAFEMDRLTPFKAEQVYYDVKVLERLAETRQIRIELALAPRHQLDKSLAELAALGWLPERVDVGQAAKNPSHDLLPEKFRPPKSALPKWLTIASSILLLSLLLAVLGLPIYMNYNQAEDLQREVKSVGKVALEVQGLREDAEKLSNEAGFLTRRKHSEPIMVDMLEELTKLIPDQTSLNGLQYREGKVIIQGQSPAASSLIERIEASPYFKNTSFVSPVTKDVSNGQERFQIASQVVNGRFSEKPSE